MWMHHIQYHLWQFPLKLHRAVPHHKDTQLRPKMDHYFTGGLGIVMTRSRLIVQGFGFVVKRKYVFVQNKIQIVAIVCQHIIH